MKKMFAALLLAASLAAPAAQAAIVEDYPVADWGIMAATDDASGLFSICTAHAKYQNGVTLLLSYDAQDAFHMSLVRDDWSYKPGSTQAIRYRLDRRGFTDASARAVDPTQLMADFPGDHAIVEQLRRGNLLTVSVAGTDYAFELSNSRHAINEARDCAARHVRADTRTAPAQQDGTMPGTRRPHIVEGPTPQQEGPRAEAAPEALEIPTQPPVATGDASSPTARAARWGDAPLLEAFTVGNWQGHAFGASGSAPAYCTLGNEGAGGTILMVAHGTDGNWGIGLYDESWTLARGQSHDVNYGIVSADGTATSEARQARAFDPHGLMLEVERGDLLLEQLADGNAVAVSVLGGMQMFTPSGNDQVMPRLEACVAQLQSGGAGAAQAGEQSGSGDLLPPLGAAILETSEIPGWTVDAYADAEGGFTHCEIHAQYENGTKLGIARAAEGSWLIGFTRTDWRLTPGERSSVRYDWQEQPGLSVEGEAVDRTLFVANMGAQVDFVGEMNAAGQINAALHDRELAFDISDIGPGFEAIEACLATHAGPRRADGGQAAGAGGAK